MATTIKQLLLEKYHKMKYSPHVPEWDDRAIFFDWCIMHGFEPGMILRRKDTTQPFGPQNCELVFTTHAETQEGQEEEWKALWNMTVNRLRRIAGLPLFPE